MGDIGLIGPADASPAAGGNYIFVNTLSGLFTYSLDLQLLSFCPLVGGRSSPAIGPDGEVLVAGVDGWFYRFPGL